MIRLRGISSPPYREGLGGGSGGGWYALRNANPHAWISAVGDARLYVSGIKRQLLVEDGVVIAPERLPVADGLVPRLALRGILPALQVSKRHLVGSHEPTTGPHLYREVTKRQAALHREVSHHVAAVLHKVTCCSRRSELGHQVECHVLGRNALLQRAVDADAHGLGFLLQNALRSQHHLYL